MLTVRFEADVRSSDAGEITFVIATRSVRTRSYGGGSIDVLIPNENGVEIAYPLSLGMHDFQRCYVMNEHGKTVARYDASMPQAEVQSATVAA